MKTKQASHNRFVHQLFPSFGFLLLFILCISPAFSQVTLIKGSVIKADSTPIQGASVMIKGENKGVTTDANGNFSLSLTNGKQLLVVGFIGYHEQEIDVSKDPHPIIVLSANENINDDVVVVGYGTRRRGDLTGAVETVSSKEIEGRPVTNLTNALQGTMAGVSIVTNSGRPGADQGSINIRGIGTLNNSNPLVIIDGIVGDLSDVNPNDVQNISVLKDAASAAIYGSRAANGVILVTTKRGLRGQVKINYDGYLGKQTPTNLPDYLPSWQAAELYNDARANEGQTAFWTSDDIAKFKDHSDPDKYPNTDWIGSLYSGNGFQQNHYINASGGSDKTVYSFSLGYYSQDGIVKKTDFERYSTRLNISSFIKDNFKVYANLSFQYAPLTGPVGGGGNGIDNITGTTAAMSRTVVNQYQNGVYNYLSFGNPLAWLNGPGFDKSQTYLFTGNTGFDWEILSGLHIKPSFVYRYNGGAEQVFSPADIYYSPTDPNTAVTTISSSYASGTTTTETYNNLQLLLEYNKNIGKHAFDIIAGNSRELTKYAYLYGYRQGFLNSSLTELNAAPNLGQKSQGTANDVALLSYFGRASYSYDDKYLLEANFRYDGSSRFQPGNQWGGYPSFSAGWNISKEAFFEPLTNIVNYLKLRGSWGKLGNQNIGSPYPSVAVISSGQNYSFNQGVAPGIRPINGANQNVTWEGNTNYGIGADLALLQNKLNLTVDYYIKKTNNILLQLPTSVVYGLSVPYQNAGAVKNSGWEFSAAYHNQAGEFKYNLSANAAFNKNEITNLSGTGSMSSGYVEGYPIQAFYGYIADGLFQTQQEIDAHATQSGGTIAPGDIKYRDVSGPAGKPDGKIDGNDRVYLGTPFPKTTFGFSAGLEWKGFALNAFFQGGLGVKNYVQGFELGSLQQPNIGNPTSALLDAWTPKNTNATFPRLWSTYTQNDPQSYVSSYWVRNASYLRLKSLELSYSIPSARLSKLGISSLKIYYSGQNLMTLTSFYKWVDPETTTGNGAYNAYPQVKTNTIGIHLVF